MSLIDCIRTVLGSWRNILIVYLEVGISKIVFSGWIIDEVNHIIENLLNGSLKSIDDNLGVAKNCWDLFFLWQIGQGSASHLHSCDNSIDHVRKFGKDEGNL